MHIYKIYQNRSKCKGQLRLLGFYKGSKFLLNIFFTIDFWYQLKNKKCSFQQYLSHIIKYMLLITKFGILEANTGLNVDPYISKARRLLISIIEQKLLRFIFSTLCTFRFFSQTSPLGSYGFGPSKLIFNISLKRKRISKHLLHK